MTQPITTLTNADRVRLGMMTPDGKPISSKQMILDAANARLGTSKQQQATPIDRQTALANLASHEARRHQAAKKAADDEATRKAQHADNPYRATLATSTLSKKATDRFEELASQKDVELSRRKESEQRRAAVQASPDYQSAVTAAGRLVAATQGTAHEQTAVNLQAILNAQALDVPDYWSEASAILDKLGAEQRQQRELLAGQQALSHAESVSLDTGIRRVDELRAEVPQDKSDDTTKDNGP